MSILGIGLGMMQGHQNERRNYRNEQNLANQQYGNQRMLNKQGQDLQMDMWNKTNYGAQVKHMIDAGLNPALMYGSAGQSGTTVSQGGGSASKGSSQMNKGTDPNAMLLGAQIDSMKAKAELDRANASAISGYQKGESESRTSLNVNKGLEAIEKASNLSEDTKLKVEQRLKTVMEKNGQDLKNQLDQIKVDKNATGSTFLDMMNSVGLDPTNNKDDQWIVRGILTAYFGADVISKIAKAFPKGVADTILRFYGITASK